MMLGFAGCKKEAQDKAAEAPPATPQVIQSGVGDTVTVKALERFALTQSVLRQVVDKLNVTGAVSPDVSRELPVLSLANGRVVALLVRLGDTVKKGQLIMEVQSPDVSTAFNGYLKAVNDQHLTAVTLERDKLLYDKGAIAKSQLEIAQTGDDDAKADLKAAEQQLRILGVDKNNPSDTVKVYAPTSGVVISQNTTAAGAAGITYAGPAGSLLIADLSHVWVVCDVYENDLAQVHLGQHGDIRLNAYPDKVYSGVVSDIGAVLDPTIRTAKVRFQVQNPGDQMRLGMFATATISGSRAQSEVAVPADAVLHLHDREYVFVPTGTAGTFRRVEIKGGAMLPGNFEEVKSGLTAGQQVVANALDLQNTADNE
jgi:cobalt-zinc-cadmium efflux system membrane fusion protein